MNNQLAMELQFSKGMTDNYILDSFMYSRTSLILEIVHIIDNWRSQVFKYEKLNLVQRLPDSEFIAIELIISILPKISPTPIQGVAVELGKRIGYHDIIDAVKIGSSIIAAVGKEKNGLLDLTLGKEGTYIIPMLQLDSTVARKISMLSFLPPNLQPIPWTSNYGGWKWEKKSVILGHGNHHNQKQCLGVLNKLQNIQWKIDLDVFAGETPENPAHNFDDMIGYYVEEKFHFTYRYDKRGRIYSSGYTLNPQGDEYAKAILSPAKSQLCTEEGLRALKIDVANYAGKDKLTWADRVDWFNSVSDWDDVEWKKPILGRKALRAYWRALEGKPIAHFVELDATASGTQIMACLTGCIKTGSKCNLTNTGKRENVYDHINKEMSKYCDTSDIETKYPTMTFFFGSKAVPRKAFNDQQLEAFYKVMKDALPGCNSIMKVIFNKWNKHALAHIWHLPDGHTCFVKVVEPAELRVAIDELGGRRFTFRYNKNTPSSNGVSLLGNIIHSVDGYVCREMVRRCKFEIACIHDCFQCHPNNAEMLKQIYRKILYDITESNLLNDICSEITGKDAGIVVKDEGLANEILNSNYALS